MNSEAIKEILDTLFSNLEKLETQTEALMQFMKETKNITDAQLAPYLEKAGNASNVRWRAARVRIEYLLSSAEMEENRDKEKKAEQAKSAEQHEKSEKDEKKTATPSGMEQALVSDQEDAQKNRKSVDQQQTKAEVRPRKSSGGSPADSRSAKVASETNTPTESPLKVADHAEEASAGPAKQRSEEEDQEKISGDQEAA